MSRVVIVIQFNDAYFKFALTLLRSLETYAKNAIKIAYTVNLKSDEIEALKNVSNELIVINSRVKFLRGRLLRNYMANRKVEVFMDAIAKSAHTATQPQSHTAFDDVYIMLDTDLLLRAPIENLLNKVCENRVGLVYREAAFGFHVKFNSSVVVVSGDGVSLIEEWKRQMKYRWVIFSTNEKLTWLDILKKKKKGCPKPLYVRRGKWFWDQITLYEAVQKLGVNYSNLEADKFINSNFDSDAVIWSGHNEKKNIVYEKFIEELNQIQSSQFG